MRLNWFLLITDAINSALTKSLSLYQLRVGAEVLPRLSSFLPPSHPPQSHTEAMPVSTFEDKPFPPFPNTQALNSSTFTKPPLDGSFNIAQMFDYHEEHSPTHPVLTYPVDSEGGKLRTIHWKEAAQAVRRGARIIRDRVDASGVRESTKWKVPMVAIVSAAGWCPRCGHYAG